MSWTGFISSLLLYHANFAFGHIPIPQPHFTDVPTTLELIENSTAWLPCTVDNLGDNVVRWWRNEVLLADSSDHTHPRPPRMRLWANNTLEIDKVKRTDSGEYICQIVRKEPWNPMQLIQDLLVLYPPEISSEPSSGIVDAKLGDTVEIACLAKGVPPPHVTWVMQNKDWPLQLKKHILILHANSPKVAQTYKCIADNGVGQPATAEIRVNILYKPIVIADIKWIHGAPGLSADLACRVTAEPDAKVQWLLNDEEFELGATSRVVSYVHGQRHFLSFRNITSYDFGNYTCRATNSEGIGEDIVELSGRAKPATFKRESTNSNDSVILIWEVDSYTPIIEYFLKFRQIPAPDEKQWITIIVPADGSNPGPIHSKSYRLSGLQRASTYEVTVASRNRYGWSETSPPFTVFTEGAKEMNGSEEEVNGSSTENIEENSVSVDLRTISKERNTSNAASLFIKSWSLLGAVFALLAQS